MRGKCCLSSQEWAVKYLTWLFLFPVFPAALRRSLIFGEKHVTIQSTTVVFLLSRVEVKPEHRPRNINVLLDDLTVAKAQEKHRVKTENGINVQLDIAKIWGQVQDQNISIKASVQISVVVTKSSLYQKLLGKEQCETENSCAAA